MIESDPFGMSHYTVQDATLYQQIVQQFIVANPQMDVYLGHVSAAFNKNSNSRLAVLNRIKWYLADARLMMLRSGGDAVIRGFDKGTPVIIWIKIEDYGEVHKFKIDIVGKPEIVTSLADALSEDFHANSLPVIKWWFVGKYGPDTRDFYLPPEVLKIHPEYYPDLDNVEAWLDDYMHSDESVLLIAGPPGTGKTTLLRHLISKYKLSAHVIYDEKLMDNDTPFQHFMFGSNESPESNDFYGEELNGNSIMIIEDADTILLPREDAGNKLMARFLNISDGLIKLPNKKLIFTTNLVDFSKVDQALLRPGRCYGVLSTRTMNLKEAQAAAIAGGMIVPTEQRAYTLAELFNNKKSTIRTVGFGVKH